MSTRPSSTPVDPARQRAYVAAIYASLPKHMQADALTLVADWPRMIHNLARAGELSAPDFETRQPQARSA